MANYRKCPFCGANLDPEEKCDCPESRADRDEVATSQPEREEKEDDRIND